MKYKIRQKVVYIGPDYRGHAGVLKNNVTAPTPLAVYTIRGGQLVPTPQGGVIPGYVVEEIINAVRRCDFTGWVGETHIPEDWLRPLQERKNDGEAFVAGLRPARQVVNVR